MAALVALRLPVRGLLGYEACEKLVTAGKLPANPVRDHVAAISVGIYKGSPVLDLDYPEDSRLRHRHECRDDRQRWYR